jgi:hypothetical protein
MPLSLNNEPEMSLMQLSQVMGTAKSVWITQCEFTRDSADGGNEETDLKRSCDGHGVGPRQKNALDGFCRVTALMPERV